jgi:predicted transcriptional regulator
LIDEQNVHAGYSSKYALTGVLVCGECGAPYHRVVWYESGQRVPVWRCRTRVQKSSNACLSPTIHEENLHAAIIKAIKEASGSQSKMMEALKQNINDVIGDDLETCDSKLKELQDQLVKCIDDGKDYDDLAEKIRRLKGIKDKTLGQKATQDEHVKRVQEIQRFLTEHINDDLEYDDSLVRKLLHRVEVNRHSIVVEFKTGFEIEEPL